MSTSVCQGLQTQFDPWLAEPRIIGFKLSQPTSKFSLSSRIFPRPSMSDNSHTQQQTTHKNDFCSELINQKRTSRNGDLVGWSLLQDLTNTTQNSEIENEKEKEEVYVHPLVKKSNSVLSEKSLEMCTESLGSETGNTISDGGDELISSSFVSDIDKSPRLPCFTITKDRSISSSSFPPPISTIRGGSSGKFQVESQRQDGRLVMKAVSVSTNQSCMKAERTNGRLMLRFLANWNELDDEGNRDFVQGGELYDVIDNENGNDDEEEDIVDDDQLNTESEGSIANVGDEVKLSNSSRRSRCNEERASRRCNELQNWEPILVATS